MSSDNTVMFGPELMTRPMRFAFYVALAIGSLGSLLGLTLGLVAHATDATITGVCLGVPTMTAGAMLGYAVGLLADAAGAQSDQGRQAQ